MKEIEPGFKPDAIPYGDLMGVIANRPAGWQALDVAHAFLVAGLVASHKPQEVLELGIGSAYLTRVILAALAANQRGSLRSVDNFFDWDGNKPSHIEALEIEAPAWRVSVADESAFLQTAPPDQYEMIISDGDHTRGYQNAPDVFRICKPGGLMVFHDTRSELYRLLARLPKRVRALGFSSFHFVRESRSDEKTSRGLLVVSKDRKRRFTLDWLTRGYLAVRNRVPDSLRRRFRQKGSLEP